MSLNNIAYFHPYEYVNKLQHLVVPDYKGYPGGEVSITSYFSANTLFTPSGSNPVKNRDALLSAMRRIVSGKPEQTTMSTDGFKRVFSGQGMPDDFIAAMSIIVKYEASFRKETALATLFKEQDYLQAMADAGCFGMDCIGFVGTYLASAGVTKGYVGRRPLDYGADFKFVKSLAEIEDNSLVMFTNGMHIQMIDEVKSHQGNSIKIDLCQSSSGGPQLNEGVTLSAGGGSYLPVESFRAKMATARSKGEYEDAFLKEWNGAGDKNNAYESYLRRTMTEKGKATGYMGGAIFQIGSDGNPANPSGNSVYVGKLSGGLSVRTPGG